MEKTFVHHTPSPEGLTKIVEIREGYSELLRLIEKNCPPSREKSIAITELETSAMWAIKSIVLKDPNSTR